MNNSNILIYTYKQPIYCCCFIQDSLMSFCTAKAIVIWDFASGKMISNCEFTQQIAPIMISVISLEDKNLGLLLQLKQTKVVILVYNKETHKITKRNEYKLEMIGFTKLSTTRYVYNQSLEVRKQIRNDLFTISHSNRIERRSILEGTIQQQFEIDQTTLEDVCYLLTYQSLSLTYFLVAEQVGCLKLFKIPKQPSVLQVNKTMKIASKEQLKIVLSIQPVKDLKAFLCLRNSNLHIINIQQLQTIQILSLTSYRIVKTIPTNQPEEVYAISGKNGIGVLKNGQLLNVQRIGKCFIVDMDTFELGAIGVTQQGRILMLATI